jgi:PAS domain S-box-containing protein
MADKPTDEELEQRVQELEKKNPEQSQSDYRIPLLLMAIEQSSEGIAVSDLDGNLEYLNHSFAKMHGYSAEELIGKNLSIFHTAQQMPSVKKANKQIKKTGSFKGVIWHVTHDGTEFPTAIDSSLVWDNRGNPIAMVWILRDVTKLHRAENMFRENEQETGIVLNSLVEHVIHQDTEMRVIWANRAACESVNLTQEELVGCFCYEIWSQRSLPCSDCPVVEAMKTGQPEEKEKYTPDGKAWFVRGYPVRDANGKIVGAIELALEITERKQAEKELQKSHIELEQRVKERTRELKNQTKKLEEINTALKVLIDKRDEDKSNLEENVLSNVNNLILPYLNKLKKIVSDSTQKIYIDVLETNVNEIILPFANKLSLKYMSLTPTEIRVANLVKQGIRTKEIAKMLDSSPKTIEAHRENIRKKIGIRNKKANLRSHLLSLH